jgi:hypothetical protein
MKLMWRDGGLFVEPQDQTERELLKQLRSTKFEWASGASGPGGFQCFNMRDGKLIETTPCSTDPQ